MEASAPFEVVATDLAGRLGRLETRHGRIDTPTILPVLHPVQQVIPPGTIRGIGFPAMMTNAYTTLRRFGRPAVEQGIHRIVKHDGPVMTDSGGYQVLEYGDVEVSAEEIARFQEDIGSDIAIVLDQPTGAHATREQARRTVERTLAAAARTQTVVSGERTLWVGPIQGGRFLDLIEVSTQRIAALGYPLAALGSPVEIMERYDFPQLVQMIATCRRVLPPDRPLHLFGAGHPLTTPLAVALGCDLMDSASYVLYARDGRYMTATGTVRLEQLTELPCICPVCSPQTPQGLAELATPERVRQLALHNLYVLQQELRACREALAEGRLWEHLMVKARSHPRLAAAMRPLATHTDLLEEGTSITKSRAPFFSAPEDLSRPEVQRFIARSETGPWPRARTLVAWIDHGVRPLASSPVFRALSSHPDLQTNSTAYILLSPVFGVVPAELADTYPAGQYLIGWTADDLFPDPVWKRVLAWISRRKWENFLLVVPAGARVPSLSSVQRHVRQMRRLNLTGASVALALPERLLPRPVKRRRPLLRSVVAGKRRRGASR